MDNSFPIRLYRQSKKFFSQTQLTLGYFSCTDANKEKKNEKAKKESNFNKKNEIPKIKENKPPKDLGKNG